MKHKYNFNILFLLVIFISISCDKKNDYITSEGILTWTGDYSVDGCGFFITINNHKYKPIDESKIDNNFKSENITVTVEYENVNNKVEKHCGDLSSPTITDGINIISIKKK